MNKWIDALLIEREGYVRKGLKESVEQVDAALRGLGYQDAPTPDVELASVEPVTETSVLKRGKKKKV